MSNTIGLMVDSAATACCGVWTEALDINCCKEVFGPVSIEVEVGCPCKGELGVTTTMLVDKVCVPDVVGFCDVGVEYVWTFVTGADGIVDGLVDWVVCIEA